MASSAPLDVNCLSSARSAGGQWEKARDLIDLMQQQGCTPDVVTYTALISAFERGGKWQLALQVLPQDPVGIFCVVTDIGLSLLWCCGFCSKCWLSHYTLLMLSY